MNRLRCECCGQPLDMDFSDNVWCANKKCLVFGRIYTYDFIESRAKQKISFHWKFNFTPGPWRVYVSDCDEDCGYPISISTNYKGPTGDNISIVRQGGHYPYSWDEQIPKCEHVANANLIAAAPELYQFLAWTIDTLQNTPYAEEEAYKSAVKLLKRL